MLSDVCETMARGQAEALFPLLEDMISRAGAEWHDLDAIGVGTGPGNFTGIRISVSAMRGLGLALEVPVVGVSLLEALAYGTEGPVLTSVAAPRGQAYVQGHRLRHPLPPAMIAVADLPREMAEPDIVSVGSAGAEIAAHLGVPHVPAPHTPGSAIARIAARRWQDGAPPPAPFYLKQADAAPARDVPPVMLPDGPP